MKKILALILVFALSFTMFTGCSKGKTRSFVYFIAAIPKALDPQLAKSSAEITAVTNIYEGLFRKNLEGKVETATAESYTVSDNGLEYTIILKDNIFYNKAYDPETQKYVTPNDSLQAVKVTAFDFEFAFKRIFDKNTNSPYTIDFQAIYNATEALNGQADIHSIGVKAIDEKTLKIRLDYPDPEFLNKLCLPGAMPCNQTFFDFCAGAYGLTGQKKPAENLLTNGEYNLTVWNDQDGITLRRDIDKNKLINRIRMVTQEIMYKTEDSAAKKEEIPVYPTANQRLADGDSNGEVLTYQNQGNYDQTIFSVTTWTISFNCTDKYFANQNIRQGIAASTSFGYINTQNSMLSRATGIIPPSVSLYDKNFRDYSDLLPQTNSNGVNYYRQGLAELQAEGVIQDTNKLGRVVVLVPDIPEIIELSGQLLQIWQRDLSAYYTVEVVGLSELNSRVETGNYQIAFYPFVANVNDSYSLLSRFQTENIENVWGISDSIYDAEIGKIRGSIGIAERAKLYTNAEKTMLDLAACIPLWYENSFFATSGVENILVNPFGPVLDLTWAQQE